MLQRFSSCRRHALQARFAACRGFTVIEVLTAVLVIAIGLIGIAALYSEALQTELETDPRAQASRLAHEMADRVNANAAGRAGYASVVGVLCVTEKRDDRKPQNAAAQEAACWQDEVEEKLPNGTGAITRDLSTNPPTYVIAVSWSAPRVGASYVIRVQPKT